jgi:FixJ family two-component response regulator
MQSAGLREMTPGRISTTRAGRRGSAGNRGGSGGPLPNVVHVVDDDASFCTAIRRRLEKAGYQVQTYPSSQHFLDQRPDESQPGCILLDARLPGLTGPELQTRLSELGSTLPIVFVTGYSDISATVLAIKAGAEDFLIKPVKSDELLTAVERALARHASSRASNTERETLHARLASLTPRERQVFELVIRGHVNKQIGHQLGTAERTIKAHRHRIMEKMLARSVPELVSFAARLGFLQE